MAETVVILGAGAPDGVGGALGRKFAQMGFHVLLCGRTQSKLDRSVERVVAAGGSAAAIVADVTSEAAVEAVFAHVQALGEPLAAVMFNAGSNQPMPFAELSAERFEEDWRIGCLGAFHTAQRALPLMVEQGRGSLLFTGASASLRGRPMFAHFASAKAALRSLVQALAREYGPQGVHIAHVVIDGVVNGDIVRGRFGDYLEQLGEEGALAPEDIADAFWMLHQQRRSAWSHELDLRPFKESW